MEHVVITARIVSDKATTTTKILHLKIIWVGTHIIAKRRQNDTKIKMASTK